MVLDVARERSGSELIFNLLRTLMVGYQFWGAECALHLQDLAGYLRTTNTRIIGLVVYLAGEGLVTLDQRAGTVRLTEDGARHLLHKPLEHPTSP